MLIKIFRLQIQIKQSIQVVYYKNQKIMSNFNYKLNDFTDFVYNFINCSAEVLYFTNILLYFKIQMYERERKIFQDGTFAKFALDIRITMLRLLRLNKLSFNSFQSLLGRVGRNFTSNFYCRSMGQNFLLFYFFVSEDFPVTHQP